MHWVTKLFGFLTLNVIVHIVSCQFNHEEYKERLELFHLKNHDLAAKFVFKNSRPIDSDSKNDNDHYTLFPKLIGLMMKKYALDEFHLSLAQGFWNGRRWGEQLTLLGVPMGAQILAWFAPEVTNPDENWHLFVSALSGFFCASFSQIEQRLSINPQLAYRPEGAVKFSNRLNNSLGRYGVLPSENVCTENLTPWKKLLPCKSASGISNFMSSMKIFDSSYASLMVDVRRRCKDKNCLNIEFELTQTIVVVLSSIENRQEFSMSKLFRSFVKQPCRLATESHVVFTLPAFYEPFFTPNPISTVSTNNEKLITVIFSMNQILENRSFADVTVKYAKKPNRYHLHSVPPPLITVHNYLTGSGQYKCGLTAVLENSADSPVKVLYAHLIPWFLRVYFHTLTLTCSGERVKPERVVYQPARIRDRPHYLETVFVVPSRSVCRLSFTCEKMLLRWTEYPPDAHHGFYIPAPSVTYRTGGISNDSSADPWDYRNQTPGIRRVTGEVLLLNLPTPDFSMPYNVICLVCTVIALAFGPVHNLTTRKLVVKSEDEIRRKSLKMRLKRTILKMWSIIRRRPVNFSVVLIIYLIFLFICLFCFCYISCDVYCRHYGLAAFCMA